MAFSQPLRHIFMKPGAYVAHLQPVATSHVVQAPRYANQSMTAAWLPVRLYSTEAAPTIAPAAVATPSVIDPNTGVRPTTWTDAEHARLISAVSAAPLPRRKHPHQAQSYWNGIAQQVGTRHGTECFREWRNESNPELKKDPWSQDEDERLMLLVNAYFEYKMTGNPALRHPAPPIRNWVDIASHLPGRSFMACRRRYRALKKQSRSDTESIATIDSAVESTADDIESIVEGDRVETDQIYKTQAVQDKFISLVANYVRFHAEVLPKEQRAKLPAHFDQDACIAPLVDVGVYLNRLPGWGKYYRHGTTGLAGKISMYGGGVVQIIQNTQTDAPQPSVDKHPELYVLYSPKPDQKRFLRVKEHLYDFQEMNRKVIAAISEFLNTYDSFKQRRAKQIAARKKPESDSSDDLQLLDTEVHSMELPQGAAWIFDLGVYLREKQLMEYVKLYGATSHFIRNVCPDQFEMGGQDMDRYIRRVGAQTTKPSAESKSESATAAKAPGA